jgi:putative pyruvate formate lyase activating enzyme
MMLDELTYRARWLRSLMKSCRLCPRACGVDRSAGETGFCGLGPELRVAKALLHHGEEPPLVGRGGSGAVFFSGCTLRCVFCQNHQISHDGLGHAMTAEALGREMLELESSGCENINLVTPTAQLPAALEALAVAREGGLRVPLVYNSGGYESVEVLRVLDGIVDIYLPDFKYGTDEAARRYSSAPEHPGFVAQCLEAVREMYRQVGPLRTRGDAAVRGLIVRHLVLPENRARTDLVLELLAEQLSPRISLSLMAQYRPCAGAGDFPEINRRIRREEYEAALETAEALGFEEGWFQDLDEIDGGFLPDFGREEPFEGN